MKLDLMRYPAIIVADLLSLPEYFIIPHGLIYLGLINLGFFIIPRFIPEK